MTQAVPSTSSAAAATTSGNKPASSAGLEGVVAAKSEICFIDGIAGRLVYRGYEIGDLVENVSFEETAFLLWDDKLPNKAELAELKKQITSEMALPPHVANVIETLPAQTQPMDALRDLRTLQARRH